MYVSVRVRVYKWRMFSFSLFCKASEEYYPVVTPCKKSFSYFQGLLHWYNLKEFRRAILCVTITFFETTGGAS